MVVWRGYLVLFGGFYEAMREVRWYNDAYVYSFQDRRWALIPQKPNAQVLCLTVFALNYFELCRISFDANNDCT